MSAFDDYSRETAEERKQRQRAAARQLEEVLRRQGFDIVSGYLEDERRGNVYQHPRIVAFVGRSA